MKTCVEFNQLYSDEEQLRVLANGMIEEEINNGNYGVKI